MPRYADLHLHTYHSDGVRSPAEVIALAKKHDLSIIAISDHDNLAAYYEAKPMAEAEGIELIPATELSTAHRGVDVHLLAYGFDPHDDAIENKLAEFRSMRERRGEAMADRLAALGFPITRERVLEIAGDGSVGRPHVAHALVEAGVVANVDEAFDQYLSAGKPGYVPKERFAVDEAIDIVHRAGGITSIAHPTLYPDHRDLVAELFRLGVDAVEILHPDVDPESREFYRELARKNGKMTTGGSDDHGFEGAITIGTIRVPEEMIAAIPRR